MGVDNLGDIERGLGRSCGNRSGGFVVRLALDELIVFPEEDIFAFDGLARWDLGIEFAFALDDRVAKRTGYSDRMSYCHDCFIGTVFERRHQLDAIVADVALIVFVLSP